MASFIKDVNFDDADCFLFFPACFGTTFDVGKYDFLISSNTDLFFDDTLCNGFCAKT